jgi:hypothetical protein
VFKPIIIERIGGADFTLGGESVSTAKDLAAMFRQWADEMDSWEDAPLSAVEFGKDCLQVTLEKSLVP